jgi:hypothetical protein
VCWVCWPCRVWWAWRVGSVLELCAGAWWVGARAVVLVRHVGASWPCLLCVRAGDAHLRWDLHAGRSLAANLLLVSLSAHGVTLTSTPRRRHPAPIHIAPACQARSSSRTSRASRTGTPPQTWCAAATGAAASAPAPVCPCPGRLLVGPCCLQTVAVLSAGIRWRGRIVCALRAAGCRPI